MGTDTAAGRPQMAGGPWLAPTVALERFVPPEGSHEAPAQQAAVVKRHALRLADLDLLLPVSVACEVVEGLTVYPVPTTPPWLLGLVNLRGNLVPVFHVAQLLGADETEGPPRRLLVFDKGERAVAIPAERLPRVVALGEPLRQRPPLPPVLREYVLAAWSVGGEIGVDVDFARLFESLGRGTAA